MIVSWNWLSQYVLLDMPVEALTERLALTGLNHESTEETGGDLAIDLEVTSNRPDCLSHIGVAREISVLFDRGLCVPSPRPHESGSPVRSITSVEIRDKALCPRFTARAISGVMVGESPWWMRKRLETLGVRPISNLVDITNYVMFECGQPLHAYDLDRLNERRLVVRRAAKGETLKAINGKIYELDQEMLVIADARAAVGLAGVMGGLDSEIGPDTANVLIESAQFDPMSVRRTARALGLFSPASYRFERPVDPERTDWASRRCVELMLELAGGTLHEGMIDVGTPREPRAPVTLRLDQIERILGITVDRAEVTRILTSLGLQLLRDDSPASLTFTPPSWRSDLEREVDLIEEVARIHGYEHIPENRPVPLIRSTRGVRERVETELRYALTGMGFDEACTFSLVSETAIVDLDPERRVTPIVVEHSSRKRENILRTALVPSLLAARAYNEAHGNADASLFEVAKVYLPAPDRPLPDEPTRLAIVAGGGFLEIKGVVESIVERLHIPDALTARPVDSPLFTPGRAAEIQLGGSSLGMIGEVAASGLERFGLRNPCAAAELSFDLLQGRATLVPRNRPLPAFPAVTRDLSLVVETALPWMELASVATAAAGTTLEALDYLDVFSGGDLPADRHSVHFAMRFRHPARTLTGEEVDRAVGSVIEACRSRLGAALRS